MGVGALEPKERNPKGAEGSRSKPRQTGFGSRWFRWLREGGVVRQHLFGTCTPSPCSINVLQDSVGLRLPRPIWLVNHRFSFYRPTETCAGHHWSMCSWTMVRRRPWCFAWPICCLFSDISFNKSFLLPWYLLCFLLYTHFLTTRSMRDQRDRERSIRLKISRVPPGRRTDGDTVELAAGCSGGKQQWGTAPGATPDDKMLCGGVEGCG